MMTREVIDALGGLLLFLLNTLFLISNFDFDIKNNSTMQQRMDQGSTYNLLGKQRLRLFKTYIITLWYRISIQSKYNTQIDAFCIVRNSL